MNRPEIAREFADIFGRFEYALKRSGFLLEKAKDARADWRKFAQSLGDDFFQVVLKSRIAPTILENPPRKLMQNQLQWMPENPAKIITVVDLFENGVCRIRNSYMHGEKFTGGPDTEQWARDEVLVTEALNVLMTACKYAPAVSKLVRGQAKPH